MQSFCPGPVVSDDYTTGPTHSLPSASFAPPLPSDDFELRQQTVRLLVLPAYLHLGFLLASVRRHLDLHEALCTVIGRLLRVRRVHRVRLAREGRRGRWEGASSILLSREGRR